MLVHAALDPVTLPTLSRYLQLTVISRTADPHQQIGENVLLLTTTHDMQAPVQVRLAGQWSSPFYLTVVFIRDWPSLAAFLLATLGCLALHRNSSGPQGGGGD